MARRAPTARDDRRFQYERALDALRRHVFRTCLEPGARVSSFEELEHRFAFGRTVLQRTIEQLKSEGFLTSVGRRGLYVAARPPHLCRIAIALPSTPEDRGWPLLASTLVAQGQRLEREHPSVEVRIHYNARPGTDEYHALQLEAGARRLAGVIAMWPGVDYFATGGLAERSLPRVSLYPQEWETNPTQVVTNDGDSFWRRAHTWLRSRGRKRIAVIQLAEALENAREKAKRFVVGSRERWIQSVDRHFPESGYHLVGLLLDYPKADRPDGLVIADDNLVEHVVAGLVRHGVRLGKDLDVVAHCNWPLTSAKAMPVRWLGCDMRAMLHNAVDFIGASRRKRPFDTGCFYLPYLFNEELDT